MKLYFLRHADAVPGADDPARPLSSRGEKECRKLAQFLREAGIEFNAAYTSPLVRARETAEIVLQSTKAGKSVTPEIVDALLNETTQREFDRWLEQLPEAKHALLVGHAPTMSERVCHLLGVADPEALRMPKGGLACLDTEDRRSAVLKFFIAPKSLGM